MATHELKLNKRFYKPTADGRKCFEIRKRSEAQFNTGDIIIFREWDDIMGNYTGRSCKKQITYIYVGLGQYGLALTHCVLGLKEVE